VLASRRGTTRHEPRRKFTISTGIAYGIALANRDVMRLSLASVLLPSLAAAVAILAPSAIANADCAAPQSYTKQVDANSVTICPTYPRAAGPGCTVAGGMIRVDTSNGAATRLPDVCGSDASADCYVDECVAPGTYQYGYGIPYACGASCGVDYFIEVTVPHVDGGTCDSDAGAGTDAAAPWDGAVPVDNGLGQNTNCSYGAPDSGVDPSPDASADAGGGGTTGPEGGGGVASPNDASDDSSGCSVGSIGGTNQTVLMVHGVGLALGIVALSRRRKRK
jgi:hypothetical protein